jgi:hypothetical protein
MSRLCTVLSRIVLTGAALALAGAVFAQPATPSAQPSAKNPLLFTAFAVSMQASVAGRVEIAIERWTTDAEREAFLTTLATKGQDKLIDQLQKIDGRTGYIRTSNSLAYDLKYCRENILPDGTRQIVIATDKPVSFLAVARQARVMDYPFSFVEMRFTKDGKGEGKLLVATAISIKNKRLELENYGQEPVRLTTITEDTPKAKK